MDDAKVAALNVPAESTARLLACDKSELPSTRAPASPQPESGIFSTMSETDAPSPAAAPASIAGAGCERSEEMNQVHRHALLSRSAVGFVLVFCVVAIAGLLACCVVPAASRDSRAIFPSRTEPATATGAQPANYTATAAPTIAWPAAPLTCPVRRRSRSKLVALTLPPPLLHSPPPLSDCVAALLWQRAARRRREQPFVLPSEMRKPDPVTPHLFDACVFLLFCVFSFLAVGIIATSSVSSRKFVTIAKPRHCSKKREQQQRQARRRVDTANVHVAATTLVAFSVLSAIVLAVAALLSLPAFFSTHLLALVGCTSPLLTAVLLQLPRVLLRLLAALGPALRCRTAAAAVTLKERLPAVIVFHHKICRVLWHCSQPLLAALLIVLTQLQLLILITKRAGDIIIMTASHLIAHVCVMALLAGVQFTFSLVCSFAEALVAALLRVVLDGVRASLHTALLALSVACQDALSALLLAGCRYMPLSFIALASMMQVAAFIAIDACTSAAALLRAVAELLACCCGLVTESQVACTLLLAMQFATLVIVVAYESLHSCWIDLSHRVRRCLDNLTVLRPLWQLLLAVLHALIFITQRAVEIIIMRLLRRVVSVAVRCITSHPVVHVGAMSLVACVCGVFSLACSLAEVLVIALRYAAAECAHVVVVASAPAGYSFVHDALCVLGVAVELAVSSLLHAASELLDVLRRPALAAVAFAVATANVAFIICAICIDGAARMLSFGYAPVVLSSYWKAEAPLVAVPCIRRYRRRHLQTSTDPIIVFEGFIGRKSFFAKKLYHADCCHEQPLYNGLWSAVAAFSRLLSAGDIEANPGPTTSSDSASATAPPPVPAPSATAATANTQLMAAPPVVQLPPAASRASSSTAASSSVAGSEPNNDPLLALADEVFPIHGLSARQIMLHNADSAISVRGSALRAAVPGEHRRSSGLQVLGGTCGEDPLDEFITAFSNVDMNTDGDAVGSAPAAAPEEQPADAVRRLEAEVAELLRVAADTTVPAPPNNRRMLAAARAQLEYARTTLAAAAARPAQQQQQQQRRRAPSAQSRRGGGVGGTFAGSDPATDQPQQQQQQRSRPGRPAAAHRAGAELNAELFSSGAPAADAAGAVGEASAALPTSSPNAVSSAELAAIIQRQNLPPEEEFFVQYLKAQEFLNTSTSFIRVEETVLPRGAGGSVLTARLRDSMIKPGGNLRYVSVNLRENGGFFQRVVRAHAERSGAVFNEGARIVKLLVFSSCQVVHTYTDGWSDDSYPYGSFPILPGSHSVGNCLPLTADEQQQQHLALDFRAFPFDTTYISVTMMSTAEADAVLSSRAQRKLSTFLSCAGPDALRPRGNDNAMDGSNIWSTRKIESLAEYDAEVDKALEDMLNGIFVPMSTEFSSKHCCDAYMLMMANTVRGYPELNPAGRRLIIRRFLAAQLLHTRRLQGRNISQRARLAHERMQLDLHSKVVLTELNVPPPTYDAVRKVTELDYDMRCVRRGFSSAKKGELGRASSALQREQCQPIPFDRSHADLVALHPRGAEYDAAQGGDPNGATLKLPASVPAMVYTPEHVKIEDLKRFAKFSMTAAPGPDGMTGYHLSICLESEEFARCFQHMVVDFLNANVSDDVIDLLIASILRGIPKGATPDAGTRPLALGGTVLKVTAHVAVKHAAPEGKAIFHGSQFGMAKGGGEYIVHCLRRFIEHGQYPDGRMAGPNRCIIALDAKNAFNMVTRTAMFAEAGKIAAMHGFANVSYRRQARLIFVGHPGKHIFAPRGVRQGEVGGVFIFNLAQQPCLNAVRDVPGCVALSYIDDGYILAENLAAGAEGTEAFIKVLEANGGAINGAKCEVMPANPNTVIDLAQFPRLAGFKHVKVLKALGASIGLSRALEKEHLEARMANKFMTMIRRLRLCPSPQLFATLRLCFLPKLGHALRVHSPEVTRDLCQMFDALISDTIRHWASIKELLPRQLTQIQLPVQLGGMGFCSQELIAPAAYKASVSAALSGTLRIARQSTLVTAMYNELVPTLTANDPLLAELLTYSQLKGADCGLSYCGSTVHPDVFSALLRGTLAGRSVAVPSNLASVQCPGCSMTLGIDNGEYSAHVPGCVKIKGGLVTVRHNSVVHSMRRLMADAGDLPDAAEPRHLRNVVCGCNKTFPFAAYDAHKRQNGCPKSVVHTSGPDILSRDYKLPFGSIVVSDVTIVSPLVASNKRFTTIDELFAHVTNEKTRKYAQHCFDAGVSRFDTLVASANGFLGEEFVRQIRRCCNVTLEDPRIVMTKFSALISRATAANLLHAETAACIRPPSLHLETLRITKEFMQKPVDASHDASTAKSDSLPRADGQNDQPSSSPSSFISAPEIARLIAQCLPAYIRAELLSLAETAVAAAISTQQQEEAKRRPSREPDRLLVESSSAAALVADPAPVTLRVDDQEELFRRNVVTEREGNARRDKDEAALRAFEASLASAQAARSSQSAQRDEAIAANMQLIESSVAPYAAALAAKSARTLEDADRRRRLLCMLQQENERLRHDTAENEACLAANDAQIRATLEQKSQAVDRYEETIEEAFVFCDDATSGIRKAEAERAKLRRAYELSQQRIAGQSESAEFRARLAKCASQAGGAGCAGLNADSPTPLHPSISHNDDVRLPNAFLGQAPSSYQQLLTVPGQALFYDKAASAVCSLYEADGAVAPPQGYGYSSTSQGRSTGPAPSSQSRPSLSSSSQQQQRSSDRPRGATVSPAADPDCRPFAGRLPASHASEPAAHQPTYASTTPAAGRTTFSSSSSSAAPKVEKKKQQQQQPPSSHTHTTPSAVSNDRRSGPSQSATRKVELSIEPQLTPAERRAARFGGVQPFAGYRSLPSYSDINNNNTSPGPSPSSPSVTGGNQQQQQQGFSAASGASHRSAPAPASAGTRVQQPSSNAASAQQQQFASGQQDVSSSTKHNTLMDVSAHQSRSPASAATGVANGGGTRPSFLSSAAAGLGDDTYSPPPQRARGVSPHRE